MQTVPEQHDVETRQHHENGDGAGEARGGDAEAMAGRERDDGAGEQRQHPHLSGVLDQHARGDEQQRERRIVAAAALGPTPAGKNRECEVGGQRQVGVARERDVRVQNRQRYDQPRADQRPQRIEAALREKAVDRQRERHAGRATKAD